MTHEDQAFFGIKRAKGERARERQYIQVFLSHKQKDHLAAAAVCEVLQANSADKIKVFMAEDIEKGSAWQQEIERQLYESDWFVLIFSGVDADDWSWCHHEAGLLCGMVYPDVKRVIVLYPPHVELPDPLKKYQGVKCEATADGQYPDLEQFFEELFGKEPYPGLKAGQLVLRSQGRPDQAGGCRDDRPGGQPAGRRIGRAAGHLGDQRRRRRPARRFRLPARHAHPARLGRPAPVRGRRHGHDLGEVPGAARAVAARLPGPVVLARRL
jgi:hypothetical protein